MRLQKVLGYDADVIRKAESCGMIDVSMVPRRTARK
jgi:hypothetical protein